MKRRGIALEGWKIRRPRHGARRGGITPTTCSCCAQSRLPRLHLGAKDIKTGSEEALYFKLCKIFQQPRYPKTYQRPAGGDKVEYIAQNVAFPFKVHPNSLKLLYRRPISSAGRPPACTDAQEPLSRKAVSFPSSFARSISIFRT